MSGAAAISADKNTTSAEVAPDARVISIMVKECPMGSFRFLPA